MDKKGVPKKNATKGYPSSSIIAAARRGNMIS